MTAGGGLKTLFATASDGARIAYTDSGGSGEAVVLIMGFAFTKEFWYRVEAALVPKYRVLKFDNRGVGETQWPGTPFTLRTLADDAIAVMDAAGVDRAHIYGASMGGGPVIEVGLNYPERVRSLVLACTMAKQQVTEPDESRFKYFDLMPRWLMTRFVGRSLYGPNVDPAKAREDRKVLNAMKLTADGLRAQTRATAAYTCAGRIESITSPTLVLHGTADKAVPYEMGQQLAALIPGAKLVTLDGAGHGYVTDSTEEANRAVLDFFAGA